jgi:hypothetical protein
MLKKDALWVEFLEKKSRQIFILSNRLSLNSYYTNYTYKNSLKKRSGF